MTRKGAAANAYLIRLRSKRAADLVIGDVVKIDSVVCGGMVFSTGGWGTVEKVDVNPDGKIAIETSLCNFGGYAADHLFRVRQSPENSARTYAEALAYQDTLTAKGEPRKRTARKS